MVSEYAAPHIQAECWALGVGGYLKNPTHPSMLRSQVSGVIANGRRAVEAGTEDALTGLPNWPGVDRDFKWATSPAAGTGR